MLFTLAQEAVFFLEIPNASPLLPLFPSRDHLTIQTCPRHKAIMGESRLADFSSLLPLPMFEIVTCRLSRVTRCMRNLRLLTCDVNNSQELLAWLNSLLQLNMTKIEQCGTGYVRPLSILNLDFQQSSIHTPYRNDAHCTLCATGTLR